MAEAKLQARIFTKDLTDEEIDALAAVAVAGAEGATVGRLVLLTGALVLQVLAAQLLSCLLEAHNAHAGCLC